MDRLSFSVLGLKEAEFNAYKQLLRLKRATILELAKALNEKRSNLYRIIEQLIERRLVSEIFEGQKHYFIAESPQILLNSINEEKRKIREVMPELVALEKEILERPKIRFFEGKQGLKNLYEELLKEKQEILAIAWPERALNKIEFFHQNFVRNRLKRHIPARVIYPDTPAARKRLKATGLKESRFCKNLKPFDAMFLVSGNKVVMFSLKNWFTGVLIENKDIAGGLRAVFNAFWERI